ncbi:unnamed protein product [Acanthoscelides obtectus]|uniref:Uncharacterized protein n=1 Tax=Acanthoscelides obtectus TaxID=200917 RepID=A0A9P0KCU6_ACAOB|nr:unnamed protein product [Acanthoscelides obtectus]CAK1677914.1 hypothetical protein AOBTE_LOCUS31644 [Acanthoscelides obtectus]
MVVSTLIKVIYLSSHFYSRRLKEQLQIGKKRRNILVDGSVKVLTSSEYMQEIISKTEKGKAHKKKPNKKKNEVLSNSEDEEIGEIYEEI